MHGPYPRERLSLKVWCSEGGTGEHDPYADVFGGVTAYGGTHEEGAATFACGGNAFGGSALRCCFGSIAAAEGPPTHPPPQAGEGRSCRAGIASNAFAAIRQIGRASCRERVCRYV